MRSRCAFCHQFATFYFDEDRIFRREIKPNLCIHHFKELRDMPLEEFEGGQWKIEALKRKVLGESR